LSIPETPGKKQRKLEAGFLAEYLNYGIEYGSNCGSVGLKKEDKMIDEKIVKQIFAEIFSSVEDVEAQSAAILQFLKDKGMANDEELAPYFERAKTSSGVRWVAIRARIEYLLSSVIKKEEEKESASQDEKPASKEDKPAGSPSESSSQNAEAEVKQKPDSPEAKDDKASAETGNPEAQAAAQKKEQGEKQQPKSGVRDSAA
jgi:hypothetical protein